MFLEFFENYGRQETALKTYKALLNFIKKINFDKKSQYQLLSADAFANSHIIYDGVDFFKRFYNFDVNGAQLQYALFIPYIMEKFIVFEEERASEQLFYQPNISKIYNTFSELNNFSKSDGEFSMSKFMFMMSYEQMYIQDNQYTSSMLRLIDLYKDNPEVNEFIVNKFGITLNKLILLHWVLFSYITKNKKTKVDLSISEFAMFATGSKDFTISPEEVELFLKYLLISKEEFKSHYLNLRKDKISGEFISYDRLTYLDRYLPRISYWYPLIQADTNMMLVSYTSLLQFLKFDRLYSLIYHNDHIKDFQSRIHGHSVTNYIQNYAKKQITNAEIYGDEKYTVGRNQYDAPDIIIEFDTYVLIIEAKSKPFDLVKAITDFDNYDFKKIEADREKSLKNIDRYLEYQNSFSGKKLYRFVCYFFEHPVMLSDMDDIYDVERIMITDIISIEHLLSIKSETHDKVLDKFLDSRKTHQTSSISHFCISHYGEELDNNHDEWEAFIKSFLK